MSEQELVVPADVVTALADLYWLFPFTKYEPSPRRPDRFISRPLAPRPAPRRQIESAAERIGQRIPDWVVALWCCNVGLGLYSYQEAGQLGQYLVEVDRAAHEAGAPPSVVFFAGSASLHPGTESHSTGKGQRGVTTFIKKKGELDDSVYGFEPSADEADPPRLIEYRHKVPDPGQRLTRLDLITYLQARERSALEADDYDVYSKETYASILAVREAKRPPFRLLWETSTRAMPPVVPAPEPEPGPVQVMHKKYGAGTVLAREGSGATEKWTIAFADATRVILARFVEPVTSG